jgi:membrane protein
MAPGPTALAILRPLRWLGRLIREVLSGWQRHRCTQLGAAISFYSIFSLFPLLILLTSIFGFVLVSWAGAASFKLSLARLIADAVSPQVAQIAIDALTATEAARQSLGLLGAAMLLVAASGAFGMLENAMQVVWDLHISNEPVPLRVQVNRFLRTRLISFLLVAGVALLAVVSLAVDVTIDTMARKTGGSLEGNWRLAELGLGFFASGLIVTLLFRWIPMRRVPWRAALAGGWLTATLWELGRQGLSAYLIHTNYARAYPILGSALAVLIWIYLAGIVFLLGAEVAAGIMRLEAKRREREREEETV